MVSRPSRFEEDFEQVAVLGKGSFGTCYKCIKRLDGCTYAVKRTNRQIRGDIDRNHVLKEVYALSSLCNAEETPHVVRYFSAWIEDGYLYIQNELCECNLEQLARTGKAFGEKEYLDLLRQVLLGVDHMHMCNMVHLDIKPANIFVKKVQSDPIYKIGDLGLVTLADTVSFVQLLGLLYVS